MLRRAIVFSLVAFLALASAPRAWAENEGLGDLDRAVETKIKAEKQRDLTATIELCQSALEKGLDEPNTRFAKGLLASTLCERASMASDAALTKGPEDPLWRNYRRLALEDLEKAVETVPQLPEALLLIARLNLLPDGDQKRVVEATDAALAIENLDPQVRSRFLLLRAGLQEDDKKKLKLLDEAVALSPAKVEPLRERGMTLAALGRLEDAAADFAKVIELDPEDAATYEEQARVLALLKRFDEALVSVDKASQLNPGSVMAITVRAEIHAEMGNLDAALHDLNQALAMRPGNPFVLLLRANLYKEMKKPEAALADIERALRRKPDLEQARRLRWSVLIGQRKLDQVISEMEGHLRKNPDDQEMRIQLAMICTAEHQPQKAIEIYSKILASDADNLDALQGRGNALLGIGKHAEAIADLNKATEIEADDSGTLNNLAWVLATSPEEPLRDGRRAIELATKACELTEFKQAHIVSTLAAAYAETGDFDTAVKWSKKALKLADGSVEPEVRQSLEKELKSYQERKPWRERLEEGLAPADVSRRP